MNLVKAALLLLLLYIYMDWRLGEWFKIVEYYIDTVDK